MMILKRFSAMTLMLFVISGIVFAQGFMGRSLDHQKARAVVVNLKSIPQQAQGELNPADVPLYLSEVPAEQLEELKERELVQKLLPYRQPQASVKDVSPEGITQVTAPNLLTSFSGIGFNSGFPPDPVIAAGPNHIMLVVNSIFWIVSKTGSLSQVPIFLATWFNNVNPPGFPFDPKVVYDQLADRWILLALSRNTQTRSSSYLLSVSQTNDPTGMWNSYSLDAELNGTVRDNNRWADWPGLGYDNCAIYITSNQYGYGGDFKYAKVRILNKSDAYNGLPLTWTDFWDYNNQGGSKVFGWKPAHMFQPPGGFLICGVYLVNTKPLGGGFVQLWKISNPAGTPTLARLNKIDIANYDPPPNAPQIGGTTTRTKINTGDCRIQDVQYRNGYLHTSFTEGYNWGQGKKAAIRYIRINTASSGILVNDIRFGSAPRHYFYPNVYSDLADNVYMVFNRCFESEYVNVRFTGKFPSETSLQTPSTLLKAGEAFYQLLDNSNRNRWGDYSGICVDPEQQYTVWMVGEYAENPSSQWGTWVGQTTFSPPAQQTSQQAETQEHTTLTQNFPNPFNATTRITYTLTEDADVRLAVFDVLGREVASLVNDQQSKGTYEVPFNADRLSSGMYYYRLTTPKITTTKSLLLLK